MEDVVIMGSVGCGEDVEDVVSVVSVEDVAESGGHGWAHEGDRDGE